MSRDDKHKKLTEDMPLGARIGMNIMLAAAPPTLRRHAIRRLKAGPRPIRKTRAERQREWEMEQARKGSEWTPSSCPWDEEEEEGSGSDSETRGVGSSGADEKQVESRRSPEVVSGMDVTDEEYATRIPSRSSRPPGFTRELRQNHTNDRLGRARRFDRELTSQGGNVKEGRDMSSRTAQEPQASNPSGYFPPFEPDMASMTTGYQRIYRWSSQVDGVPEDLGAADDGRSSVSTAWPGPRTDAGDDVDPGESISVKGEDEGLYRRGKIAASSRGSVRQSESTKWSESGVR